MNKQKTNLSKDLSPSDEMQIKINSYESMTVIALNVTKSLLLINGGAAVALLAFLGQVANSNPTVLINLSSILPSLLAFLCGAFFSVGAACAGYFAQLHFTLAPTDKDLFKHRPLQMWRRISIILVLLGLLSFIFGSICGAYSLTHFIERNKTSSQQENPAGAEKPLFDFDKGGFPRR